MKKGLREIIIIFLTTSLAIGSMGYLTARQYSYAASEFPNSGYILDTSSGETGPENINLQYYFNGGEKYTNKKTSSTVDFKTADGEKVSLNPENFVHYSDNSMCSFAKSVILDTDDLNSTQTGYYALPKETKIQSQGTSYTISNAGETLNLENYVWKISESQYMVVSPTITLWISEDSYQTFTTYVQVQYKDSGIAYIVNQEGTYSTVSSGAYLELENGIRIYLGSKNVSTDEGILMSLAQMIVNATDNIEIIPDVEYKNENIEQPQIVIEANDGMDGQLGREGDLGDDGEEGDDGDDGEEGDAGSVGTAGQAGSQGGTGNDGIKGITGDDGEEGGDGGMGNPGVSGTPGTPGDPGPAGTSADTAGVTYTKAVEPEFSVVITPSTYGMASTITYKMDPEGKNRNILLYGTNTKTGKSYDSYVTIVESATGNMIYRTYPDNWKETGTDVQCSTLKPSTNYTYIVTATYTDSTGETVTKDVLTKYFSTGTLGLDLDYKYVTDSSIAVDFLKECDSKATVYVKVTDLNDNLVGYMKPVDVTDVNFEDNGISLVKPSTFDIENINIDEKRTLLCGGLNSDTTYNVQLVVQNDNLPSGAAVMSGYTFPVQTYRTLKKTPSLGSPVVAISGLTNSFIVSPGEVEDKDNGIVSYRYEIYNASALTGANGSTLYFSENPVYTVDTDKLQSIKVKVDEDKIKYGSSYIARLVAVFDNNEKEIEYSSTISAAFSMDRSAVWPSVSNTMINVAPSAIDGKISVSDLNFALSRTAGTSIKVYIAPATSVKTGADSSWSDAVCIFSDDLGHIEGGKKIYEAAKFDINYNAIGLKQGTRYTVSVVVSSLSINDEIVDNNGQGVVLMTDTIETPYYYDYDKDGDGLISTGEKGYNSLSMHLTDSTPQKVTIGSTEQSEIFREYFYFYTDTTANGRGTAITGGGYSPITSSIPVGSETLDMQHFSAKSLGYIEFSLCKEDGTVLGTCKKYIDSGKYAVVSSEKQLNRGFKFGYKFGYPMTVSGISGTVLPYTETDNITNFSSASAYKQFGIALTVDDFDNNGTSCRADKATQEYFNQANVRCMIKVKAYDYTYGWVQDGSSAIWSDGVNKGNLIFSGSKTFSLPSSFPIWSIVSSDFDATELSKKDYTDGAKTRVVNGRDLTTYSGTFTESTCLVSNYPTTAKNTVVDDLDAIYSDLNNGTLVALKVNGPAKGILNVAAEIKYEVYSKVTLSTPGINGDPICTGYSGTDLLAESGWLSVNNNATTFPSYVFLVDENNAEASDSSTATKFAGRGYEYYVVAHIRFKNEQGYTVDDGTGSGTQRAGIYPDDYINKKQSNGQDVEGYLYQTFCFAKQKPEIKIAQKDGIIGSANSTTVYNVWIKDVDEALMTVNDANYIDYKKNFDLVNFYDDTSDTICGQLYDIDDAGNKITEFPYILRKNGGTDNFAATSGITSNKITLRYKEKVKDPGFNLITIDNNKADLTKANPFYLVSTSSLTANNDTKLLNALKSSTSSESTLTGNGLHLDSSRTSTFEIAVADGLTNTDKTFSFGFYFVAGEQPTSDPDSTQLAAMLAEAQKELLRYDLKFTDAGGSTLSAYLSYDASSAKITGPDAIEVDTTTGEKRYIYKLTQTITCVTEPDLVAFAGKNVNVQLKVFSQGNKYGLDCVKDDKYISSMFYKNKTDGYLNYYPDSAKMVVVPDNQKYLGITDVNKYSSGDTSFTDPLKLDTAKGVYLFRYNKKDRTKSDAEFAWITSNFNSDGLVYLPRQINCDTDTASTAWHGGYAAEATKITFVSGYSRSNMTINIGKFNTIDSTNTMKVVYISEDYMPKDGSGQIKSLSYSEWQTLLAAHPGSKVSGELVPKDVDNKPVTIETITQNGNKVTLPIEGLKNDEKYYFAIFTDSDPTSAENWQNVMVTNVLPAVEAGRAGDPSTVEGYFTTAERVDVAVNKLSFAATAESRDSKSAKVELKVTDALWGDVSGGAVSNAWVDILDSKGNIVSTVNVLNDLRTNFPAASQDNSKKESYTFTVSSDWKPLTDESHLMDGVCDYTAKLHVAYQDGTEDTAPAYSTMAKTYYNVQNWRSMYPNRSYFEVIPKAYYDYNRAKATGDDNSAVITCTITGEDALRVFNDNAGTANSGKVRYKVELMQGSDLTAKATQYTGYMQIVDGVISPVSNYDPEKTLAENAGRIAFIGLEPASKLGDSKYWLRTTLEADSDNDGVFEQEVVVNTEKILTPGKGVSVNSVTIRPSDQLSSNKSRTVTVTGTNLEYLTSISYTLSINSVVKPTVTITNPATSLQWVQDTSQNNTYYLCITDIDKSSQTYQLSLVFDAINAEYGINQQILEYKTYTPGSTGAIKLNINGMISKLTGYLRR